MIKNKKFFSKKNIVILIILTMFFVLDRYLKFLALKLENSFYLIKDILKFTFYPNEFISFSIPFKGPVLLALITILLILVLINIINLFKKKFQLEGFFWFLVFLGAISNFIDRLKFSFVIDYFDFLNLTVFNLADVFIVVGCFSIILINFKNIKK